MLDAYCPDLIILDLGLPRYGWSGYHPTYSRVERCSNYSGICQTRERDKIEALILARTTI